VEEEVHIEGVKLKSSSMIIFDIKAYDIKNGSIQNYGFAIYPLTMLWE
jgi:hypothetical protein